MTGQQSKQIAKSRAYQERQALFDSALGEEYQERAAIIEYEAKKSRSTAEFEARRQILAGRQQTTLQL